ncbi:MAG: hypothetical protein A2W90_00025 [Bacteroidetes bacterium GWF2_42_66]|nr:MAG: hypothetical protein A2W92_09205 [Bacteroidetes bacterium GWA2_42_15]OFX97905.1 MAG: hypothetical protein A2W89_07560 [Bacteroidetes bacterium GWE2_42_39]OFY44118.1 MAG: hypothetical protein A2W90_00025 [Bacteroidetes bacterium GWF2_42_66]HAZ03390.1 hypothetical protein [Marinilabiliales bacterium]HBL74640.1 hypothetical protein [Prolixibacteraceae bacterium]
MLRRKFIEHFGNIGGAALIGPLVVDENHLSLDRQNGSDNFFSEDNTAVSSAEVMQYNGKPTVFVNEKAYFPMAFISYYPKQFRYRNMEQSGMRFFSLSITLGDRFVASHRKDKVSLGKKGIWDAPNSIDFDLFDKSINEILEVAPDSYIFPRIYCDSPSWWDSFHPAETNRTYDGFPQRQSFSSLVWRNETADVLRKIIRHIRQSLYSARIVGLHITAGNTEEASHHKFLGDSDYGMAAQNGFKQWLLRRYNNDESVIKKYFEKSLHEISIPSPEERKKAGMGDFLDPEKSRLVIDYNIFRCEEVVDSLEFLCRTVKEESKEKLLTGVFYGYTLVGWRDHSDLTRLLKSPYIDFLSNTNGAGKRTILGEDDLHFLSETDSIHKANKLFYYEADTRTCMSKWISELQPEIDPFHEYDLETWLGPETIEKTINLLKAVFSRVICTGSAHWWFDLWGGWYDHDQIQELLGKMQKIGDESIHLPRKSVAEVCVFVEDKSLLYYATTGGNASSWIHAQMNQIGKMGAPFDIYLTDDLNDIDVSRYRVFIFLNPIYLTQQNIQIIRRKCMNGNRALIWLYAPGLIGNKLDVSNVSSVISMDVDYAAEHHEMKILVDIDSEKLNYQGTNVSPFVYIKNGMDKIYGRTEDGYVVLASKKEKDYLTVFASVPPVPWQTIQHFAKQSGVHIYSDTGDVVYANQSYLSVSAAKPGKRQIRLPGKSRLQELLGEDTMYEPGSEHEIYFSETSCRFFRILA